MDGKDWKGGQERLSVPTWKLCMDGIFTTKPNLSKRKYDWPIPAGEKLKTMHTCTLHRVEVHWYGYIIIQFFRSCPHSESLVDGY